MARHPDDPAVPVQLLRALDRAGVPFARLQPDGLVIAANPAFSLACGRPSAQVVGSHVMDLVLEDDRSTLLDTLAVLSAEPEDVHVAEVRFDAADGRVRVARLHLALLGDTSSTVVCVLRDHSGERRRSRQDRRSRMEDMRASIVDPTTGLPNERSLELMLGSAARRADREGHVFSMLRCELDPGDAALDDVVVVCAERIRQRLRNSDSITRVARDALAVLAEDLHDEQDAAGVAYRVLSTVVEAVELEGGPVQVRMSVGVAVGDGATPATSLAPAASRAAAAARAEGPGGFRLSDLRAGQDDS